MKSSLLISCCLTLILFSCSVSKKSTSVVSKDAKNNEPAQPITSTVVIKKSVPELDINTKKISAADIIAFAKLQLGIPYLYGGTDRKKGFDCSGFINYVFNHFGISVPRISYQFTNAGVNIPIEYSKPGDLILFTGSNARSGIVGHMGIITENNKGDVKFIHASTSSGIIISGMSSYFILRFVKVNRVFIPLTR